MPFSHSPYLLVRGTLTVVGFDLRTLTPDGSATMRVQREGALRRPTRAWVGADRNSRNLRFDEVSTMGLFSRLAASSANCTSNFDLGSMNSPERVAVFTSW